MRGLGASRSYESWNFQTLLVFSLFLLCIIHLWDLFRPYLQQADPTWTLAIVLLTGSKENISHKTSGSWQWLDLWGQRLNVLQIWKHRKMWTLIWHKITLWQPAFSLLKFPFLTQCYLFCPMYLLCNYDDFSSCNQYKIKNEETGFWTASCIVSRVFYLAVNVEMVKLWQPPKDEDHSYLTSSSFISWC